MSAFFTYKTNPQGITVKVIAPMPCIDALTRFFGFIVEEDRRQIHGLPKTCLLWQGSRMFRVGGETETTPKRFMMRQYGVELLPNEKVYVTCQASNCVRFEHLRRSTPHK